jgi:SAM-dependent methyltransferase
MHREAFNFVRREIADLMFERVVEFGSLNINGTIRGTFRTYNYHGIDLQAGPGVDEIADACWWEAPEQVDAIACCEVLEHAAEPARIVRNAWRNLRRGGLFVMTCATDPREPHSAVDGGPLRPSEHYQNIDPNDFKLWCKGAFLIRKMEVHDDRGDLYAIVRKP